MPTWCPKCHAMLPEGGRKCPECGARIREAGRGKITNREIFILSSYIIRLALVPLLVFLFISALCLLAIN